MAHEVYNYIRTDTFNEWKPRGIPPENFRGGADPERLYLENLVFRLQDGQPAFVKKTDIPGVDMADLTARHKARYDLVLINTPAKAHVLDWPCGSGYGAELLTARTDVTYEGREIDPITVAYAQELYGGDKASFAIGDMRNPDLASEAYNTIACVEGYEHIEREFQLPLLQAFHKALKPGGTLVISSPENPDGKSGKSSHNKAHLYELTGPDFIRDLQKEFGENNVTIISQVALASTHVTLHMLYGICKKTA